MKIQINITKEVLYKTRFCAKDGAIFNCAISYTVRAIFPEARTTFQAIHPFMNKADSIMLPPVARLFIINFDKAEPEQRQHMKPFSFEIDVPDNIIQHIGINQVYKILSESKTLQHVNNHHHAQAC